MIPESWRPRRERIHNFHVGNVIKGGHFTDPCFRKWLVTNTTKSTIEVLNLNSSCWSTFILDLKATYEKDTKPRKKQYRIWEEPPELVSRNFIKYVNDRCNTFFSEPDQKKYTERRIEKDVLPSLIIKYYRGRGYKLRTDYLVACRSFEPYSYYADTLSEAHKILEDKKLPDNNWWIECTRERDPKTGFKGRVLDYKHPDRKTFCPLCDYESRRKFFYNRMMIDY